MEQVSFNFMAAVTICSDFWSSPTPKKVFHCFHCFPSFCHEVMGLDTMFEFSECWVLRQLFHSFHFQEALYVLFTFCHRVVPSAYLRLLIFLPAILIPARASSTLAFLMQDCLTHLLRNLYSGQEVTIRTRHGKTVWLQIRKGVCQGCILSPCLFNLFAEYIMRNSGLDETQAGIKIARRNINNLRYADDTTLMAESGELKSLLMKVKEESEKVGLKLNTQKIKIMAFGPITS